MVKNIFIQPIIGLMTKTKNSSNADKVSDKRELYFSRKQVIVFCAAIILFSAAFGIKLAEYLSYARYDSVSIRFGTMYEYILRTNVSFLESLTLEDRPDKLPSLDNHNYFINFGQVMTHGDPDINNRVDNAVANLRILQDNYEFLAETIVPYHVAYSEFIPNQSISRRNPDPIITHNGVQMKFSDYRRQHEEQINTRRQQLIRLTIMYKQYIDQYMKLSGLLRNSER
jgi:hypothetical protein